jgi:hypothetical protein
MDSKQILMVAGVILLVVAGISLGRVFWRWRIGRWARAQGFRLVGFTGAKFYEGPSAFFRTENRDEFHVVVEDGQGRQRSGWLCFGSNLNPFSFAVEMRWDDGGRPA